MRAARRATLLVAIRADGYRDKRIPFFVSSGPMHNFLRKVQWPRPRASAVALVGDVALSMQRDIFASLPQLVIALLCDLLCEANSTVGADAVVLASDVFALGASVWMMSRINK